MAKITEFREIPLDDLEIGKGQSRTRQVSEGISELAESIDRVGLLEPIVVCPGSAQGKYEILTGQRRFLAHRELQRDTIWAAILDQRVDELEAKVISVTENLVRRDLNRMDLIDACTYLYKKYGSVRAVVDETGLGYGDVATYVKYDRLTPKLKEMVDQGELNLQAALRAQTAAEARGDKDVETQAIASAKEMNQMTGVQQRKLGQQLEKSTGKPIEDAVEEAKSGARVTQIVVTLGEEIHGRLQQYASDEGTNQDDAALTLIEEGLSTKGYID